MINFPPDLLGSDILVNAKREEMLKLLAKQQSEAARTRTGLIRDPSAYQEPQGDVQMLDNSLPPEPPEATYHSASVLPQSASAIERARIAASSPPAGAQSVLPATRAAAGGGGYGGGAAGAAAAKSSTADLDTELATLRARRDKQMEDPDYGPLKQQMMGRAFDVGDTAIGSMLAGIGPDWTQGMAAPMAARSMKLAEPMKIEGGEIDIGGNVRIDPGFKRTQMMEFLQKRINELEVAKTRAITADQHMELTKLQHEAMRQARGIAAQQRADELAFKREQAQRERWKTVTVNDEAYIYDSGAKDPAATLKRVSEVGGVGASDVLPKRATNEEKKNYANYTSITQTMPGAIEQVRANPEAFGLRMGVAERLGGAVGVGQAQVPIVGKALTADQQAARAHVFTHYANVIHELIGSAQTEIERRNLYSFVPLPGEQFESVINKMEGAIAYANSQRSALQSRYGMGGGAAAGAQPPGAPRPGGNPYDYMPR